MNSTASTRRLGAAASTHLSLGARLGLNSLWLILARGGSQLFSFLFALLIARHLGHAALGQFAFIAALVLLGNVITTFGMDTLLVREIAGLGHLDATALTSALLLQLGLAAVFVLAVLVGSPLLTNQTAATLPALWIATFSLLPMAFSTSYSAALRAFERMELLLVATIVPAASQVVAALILLRQGAGLLGMAWVMVAGQVGAAILTGALAWRFLPGFEHRWPTTIDHLRKKLYAGFPLALLMAVAVLYQRAAILGLSLLATDEETGWFAAAARLVEAAKLVPYAYFGALFPVLARVVSGGTLPVKSGKWIARERQRQVPVALAKGPYSAHPLILLLFGLFLPLVTNILAAPIIGLLYGEGYEPAVALLRVLSWGLLPFLFTIKSSVELVSAGHEKLALLGAIVSTLVLGLLILLLRATHGLRGVAWAVVVAEIVQALILLYLSRRTFSHGS